ISTLRCTYFCWKQLPIDRYSTTEKFSYQPQNDFVLNMLFNIVHQSIVIHCIEVLLQINIYNCTITLIIVFLCPSNGIMSTTFWSETETVFRKSWVNFFFDYLENGLLYKTVFYCRNT